LGANEIGIRKRSAFQPAGRSRLNGGVHFGRSNSSVLIWLIEVRGIKKNGMIAE
jgi:hypothetical protein